MLEMPPRHCRRGTPQSDRPGVVYLGVRLPRGLPGRPPAAYLDPSRHAPWKGSCKKAFKSPPEDGGWNPSLPRVVSRWSWLDDWLSRFPGCCLSSSERLCLPFLKKTHPKYFQKLMFFFVWSEGSVQMLNGVPNGVLKHNFRKTALKESLGFILSNGG